MSYFRLPTHWVVPALFVLLTWGWYRLYALDQAQSGTWGCEMSWMTPSYIKIDMAGSPFSRYALYLYREIGWDTEQGLLGHPAIFIPGNAGSYQQVRSIASSTSRQYHGHPGKRAEPLSGATKIDMFTLDLNEDFSAFHPQLIREQADYLAHAVRHIAGLYEQGTRITLIGHSMGGIVARLSMELGIEDMIDMIITMSTPHQFPPVTLDGDFDRIYGEIARDISPILVNICGGAADTQIASDACALLLDTDRGLTVFSTAIPGAWTGVDHQAMVWCHQVRWVVARLLLEATMVNSSPEKLGIARQLLYVGHRAPEARNPSRRFEVNGLTTFLLASPPSAVSACDNSGCRPLDHDIQPYPRPAAGSPFPLPGEGVKQDDTRYALSLNWTGSVVFDVAGEVESGTFSHVVPPILQWTPSPSHTTHYRLKYPTLESHSLAVHRLRIGLESCSGPVPIVRYAPYAASNLVEERFFPADSPDILLHPHIARAPFAPSTRPQGMRLDIYQSPDCPVTSIAVNLEIWRSLAKAVHRYRMAAVAWTLGWSALIVDLCLLRTEQSSALPAWWTLASRHRIVQVLTGLMAVFLILAATGSRISALVLLGVDEIILSIVVLALSVWTLLLAMSLYLSFHALRLVMRSKRSHTDPASTTCSRSYTLVFCAVSLGVGIWVPHEILLTLLAVMQVLTLGVGASDPSVAILLLSLALAPYDVARLIGWARAAIVDWTQAPRMTHNPLKSLPLFALYALRGNQPRPSPVLLQMCGLSLKMLAAASFLIGPRHTYVLPWIARAVSVGLCALLWPIGNAATVKL